MEGKAGIKMILQSFDPCFPLHLLSLSKRKAGIKELQDGFDPCFDPFVLIPQEKAGIKAILQLFDPCFPFAKD